MICTKSHSLVISDAWSWVYWFHSAFPPWCCFSWLEPINMSFSFLIICIEGKNVSVFVVGNWFSFCDKENIWRKSGAFGGDKQMTGKWGWWKGHLVCWQLHLLLISQVFAVLNQCLMFGTKAPCLPQEPFLILWPYSVGYWEACFLEIIAFLAFSIFISHPPPCKQWNDLKIWTVIFNSQQK